MSDSKHMVGEQEDTKNNDVGNISDENDIKEKGGISEDNYSDVEEVNGVEHLDNIDKSLIKKDDSARTFKFKDSTGKLVMLVVGILLIMLVGIIATTKKNKSIEKTELESNIHNNIEANIGDTVENKSSFKTVLDLKNYYKYRNNRLSPIYNVKQTEEFEVMFKTSTTLPEDAIGVYTNKECNAESKIDTVVSIEKLDSGQKVVIKPYAKILSRSTDIGWGNAPVYFIKINYDLESDAINKLSEPYIIPFKTENIIEAPILKCTISENGIFKLNWSRVSNATSYRIYKTDSIYTNNETGASTGYKNNIPTLVTEVDGNTLEWYDWVNNNTNGLGNINGEYTLYENFGLSGEYYVTAVCKEEESKYSNSILVSNYSDILPVRLNNEDMLNPGDYVENARDLPRSVEVKTLNNDIIKYNINYKIDETTRYKDNVYYNYSISGTELKGYIEIRVGNVTNLPSEIKNGIETYENGYDIEFNVVQNKNTNDEVININEWIKSCKNEDDISNSEELTGIESMVSYDLDKMDCEDYYLILKMLNYESKIDLRPFQDLQDYIELEDKIQKICYQNPLIYGIKGFSYNENLKELKVIYKGNVTELKTKRDEIYNKVVSKLPLIVKSQEYRDIINDIYIYMNDNYIYNKDGDLYELIVNNAGNALAYSQLFKMFCDELDLKSIVVSGSLNGNLHTWNSVCYDNKDWYYIDVTNNLKNVGMQRMCYNMSSEYAKNIGYLSDDKYTENKDSNTYKSTNDVYEYYRENDLVAANPEKYFEKVKELVARDAKVITVRYTGEEIKSSDIISNISSIFKEENKELELGKLRFGDGLGYYVLWYED